ncbi:hypothetical protein [Microbulbifer epialgicus]|uniref:Uncharacterized protein n=1 Tax=Microbulbifer epialgicus TaxID=393907 RepID=A0ABV4NU37_9GAMM
MPGAIDITSQPLEGAFIRKATEWTRITDVSQLEIGAEYYITWYSQGWGKYKNTIAEFIGDVDEAGLVTFEHSDLPWGSLEDLRVYVAPKNPSELLTLT